MIFFLLRRLMSLAIVMTLVTLIVFLMMHSIPGGPWDEEKMPLSPEAREIMRQKYGLDQPLWQQYVTFISNAFRFDFGYSYQNPGEPISATLARTWPISAALGGAGLGVALIVGITLGIMAAMRPNSWVDYLTTFLATASLTMPVFVFSILLIVIFSIWLGWLPTGGIAGPRNWIMPILAYALIPTGVLARYTRSSLLEVLRQDYIRTARAKGVGELAVVLRHAMRNGSFTLLTVFLPMVAGTMTGSIFVEQIFRVPGLGSYFVSSITQRDYPMELTLIFLLSLMLGLIYLITDILYAVLDPRVRVGGGR